MKQKLHQFLLSFLDKEQIINGSSTNANFFLKDQRNSFSSTCMFIVLPKTSNEASLIIKYCYENNINIVPQSGNTGLVGGSVAENNSIIINSKNLKKIIEIDKNNFSITVQGGITLKELQNICAEENLYFPLSLPSEENCTIAGNIATNAGGINVVKYGSIRDLVLGLEVVLPNGDIYNDLNTLRKRNIGSDFKHLFIGSEGTLGFITSASLKLFPMPKNSLHILFTSDNLLALQDTFALCYKKFYYFLSSFEIFNNNSYDLVKKFYSNVFTPLENNKWNFLFSLNLPSDNESFIEEIKKDIYKILPVNKNNIYITKDKTIWQMRYLIPKSQKLYGDSLKHDISLPLSQIIHFIIDCEKKLQELYPNILYPIIFGHMGDGNLHFNLSAKNPSQSLQIYKKEIKNLIVKKVMKKNGTFSAEHGIGLIHKEELKNFYSNNQYKVLQSIKKLFDSKNNFNPSKLV